MYAIFFIKLLNNETDDPPYLVSSTLKLTIIILDPKNLFIFLIPSKSYLTHSPQYTSFNR